MPPYIGVAIKKCAICSPKLVGQAAVTLCPAAFLTISFCGRFILRLMGVQFIAKQFQQIR